jgi:oxygen-independent coproporphyrinogen-3 oxidase
VPGLSPAALADSLDRLLALSPDHLSVYGLTIEPGTAFGEERARGTLREIPDEDALHQDALAEERAVRAGLRRYEVSNYARPGHECRHNLSIWRGAHYLGLGPSAASYLPEGPYGTRRANAANLSAYVARLAAGESPVAMVERLTRREAMVEARSRLRRPRRDAAPSPPASASPWPGHWRRPGAARRARPRSRALPPHRH